MTEQHIINAVVKQTGVDRETVSKILDLIFAYIKHGVFNKSKHMVQIRNFGMFKLKFLGKRNVPYNYVSGEDYVVDAHMKMTFKAYSDIMKRLYRKELRRRKRDEDALAAIEAGQSEGSVNDDSHAEQGSDC